LCEYWRATSSISESTGFPPRMGEASPSSFRIRTEASVLSELRVQLVFLWPSRDLLPAASEFRPRRVTAPTAPASHNVVKIRRHPPLNVAVHAPLAGTTATALPRARARSGDGRRPSLCAAMLAVSGIVSFCARQGQTDEIQWLESSIVRYRTDPRKILASMVAREGNTQFSGRMESHSWSANTKSSTPRSSWRPPFTRMSRSDLRRRYEEERIARYNLLHRIRLG